MSHDLTPTQQAACYEAARGIVTYVPGALVLTLVGVVLKLGGVIALSWLTVTWPLWLLPALMLAGLAVGIVGGIVWRIIGWVLRLVRGH